MAQKLTMTTIFKMADIDCNKFTVLFYKHQTMQISIVIITSITFNLKNYDKHAIYYYTISYYVQSICLWEQNKKYEHLILLKPASIYHQTIPKYKDLWKVTYNICLSINKYIWYRNLWHCINHTIGSNDIFQIYVSQYLQLQLHLLMATNFTSTLSYCWKCCLFNLQVFNIH